MDSDTTRGGLFGLQFSNPVNTKVAYRGQSGYYGQKNDPMVGGCIVGVSGDTSSTSHNTAWKTRDTLKLDFVPNGVAATQDDNIVIPQAMALLTQNAAEQRLA